MSSTQLPENQMPSDPMRRFSRIPPSRGTGGHHAPRRVQGGALVAAGGILFLALFLVTVAAAQALEVPRLLGRVNDYARMLSPETANRLNAQLADFERSDSTQVVVLTIPSLEGEPLEDYSVKVAQAWGVGQKGKDNGVLLLVSKADRKVRIEVGYGLEGRLTDALSGRIIDQAIVPAFKSGNFDKGIEAGVSGIIAAIRGEYQGGPDKNRGNASDDGVPIFGIVVVAIILSAVLSGLSPLVRAGIFGVVLPVVGLLLAVSGAMVLLLLVGGIVLGLVGPFLFRSGRGGGGGFFIGGGGGSSSGGGFSGGGGSFGGGGSSGSW